MSRSCQSATFSRAGVAADRTSLELVRVYGGGKWQQFVRVRAIAALPNTFAALQIAAPSAVLGAIIGEYLGGVDSGIGVALTAAQTAYNVPRTWGLALAAAAPARWLVIDAAQPIAAIHAQIMTRVAQLIENQA